MAPNLFSAVSGGALFGAMSGQSNFGPGNIYQLVPPASSAGTWTETLLHVFQGPHVNHDGADPYGGLLALGQGAFIGTTNIGGAGHTGTAFIVTVPN